MLDRHPGRRWPLSVAVEAFQQAAEAKGLRPRDCALEAWVFASNLAADAVRGGYCSKACERWALRIFREIVANERQGVTGQVVSFTSTRRRDTATASWDAA